MSMDANPNAPIIPRGSLNGRPEGWVIPEGERFVLGLDIDNVCADYSDAFRWHVARNFNVDPSHLEAVKAWDFTDLNWGIKDRAQYEQLHLSAVREGMFRTMKKIEGVSESLHRLSKANVHIRVVSHRLFIKGLHEVSAADTIHWLDKNDIPYRGICLLEQKDDVWADIFIDDGPHNIRNLRASGKSAIVFDQLYNQEVDGLRAYNWQHAEDIILDAAYAKYVLNV